MNGFIVVGTDTDAGKTSFALLFLTAYASRFDYWKPVETGESDCERIRSLVPDAIVHAPLARFRDPVAPMLAAKREGRAMPSTVQILSAIPPSTRPLVIETFGGPLSPLTDDVLQIELIRELRRPVILVTSSSVGAVGRTLATLQAMAIHAVKPAAVVLIGQDDPFARAQIGLHGESVPVVNLELPTGTWTTQSLASAARQQHAALESIRDLLSSTVQTAPDNYVARDRAVLWHPYTSLAEPADPLVVINSEREFLYLSDGRVLIDAISSWWTILHGHRHPPLMRALRQASETLDHVIFAGVTHAPAIELAEMLLQSAPWKGGRVFYSDNGSTAVEVALKMAYQYWCHRGEPARTLFVGFENGYHGDTFGAMAVGRDPLFFGTFEPLLFRAIQSPVEAGALDALLTEHAGKVAAVILEPLVQGAGGMQMHSPEQLRVLFNIARRHKVLFIADEVMTGCRTGRLWAHDWAGIAPDLICSAKTLTGGILPLAATLVAPEIVAQFETADRAKTFFHGHSFTANPLSCSVALQNWRILMEQSWQDEAERIAAFWQKNLLTLNGRTGIKGVRLRGTIAAIELDVPGGYLSAIGTRIRNHAISRGVLLRPLGSVVYAMPPLCTAEQSLQRIVDIIFESVDLLRN